MSRPPLDIGAYEANDGYQSLHKIAAGMSAADVLETIKSSGLKGRGGAGFPTGLKWSFVPQGESSPQQKYLVVNADEMEPGTFKDRLLMEGDPHLLLEGMIISAYAIGASKAYIFLRGEYHGSVKTLKKATAEAYEKGYLGSNILGTGYDLDIILHTSAGRYICGEETALLNALEGKRANPRAKPPFPQVSGLWGKPTIVNNVETLCNLPGIITYGIDWYQGLGRGCRRRHQDVRRQRSGEKSRGLGDATWSDYPGTARGQGGRYAGRSWLEGVFTRWWLDRLYVA